MAYRLSVQPNSMRSNASKPTYSYSSSECNSGYDLGGSTCTRGNYCDDNVSIQIYLVIKQKNYYLSQHISKYDDLSGSQLVEDGSGDESSHHAVVVGREVHLGHEGDYHGLSDIGVKAHEERTEEYCHQKHQQDDVQTSAVESEYTEGC